MIPVITLIGLQVAILLAGASADRNGLFLERHGKLSGAGASPHVITRAVQSVITVFALLVALISLAVDVIYSLVDPRVRY